MLACVELDGPGSSIAKLLLNSGKRKRKQGVFYSKIDEEKDKKKKKKMTMMMGFEIEQ